VEENGQFYVHMTGHPNRNSTIKINRRTNFQILFWYLTCFGQFLCPSSGVIDCTFGTGKCYKGLTTASVQDQDGTPCQCRMNSR